MTAGDILLLAGRAEAALKNQVSKQASSQTLGPLAAASTGGYL